MFLDNFLWMNNKSFQDYSTNSLKLENSIEKFFLYLIHGLNYSVTFIYGINSSCTV